LCWPPQGLISIIPVDAARTHKRKCTQSKTINPRATAAQTISRIAPPSQTPALHLSKLETNNNHPPSTPSLFACAPNHCTRRIHRDLTAVATTTSPLLRPNQEFDITSTILRAPSLALSRVDYRIDLQTLQRQNTLFFCSHNVPAS